MVIINFLTAAQTGRPRQVRKLTEAFQKTDTYANLALGKNPKKE